MWLAAPRIWLSLLLVLPTSVLARCDPTVEPDRSDVANARAAVAANCDCAGAASRGDYVRCAAQQAEAVIVNRGCRGRVKKCATKSICGKPGSVTCCRAKDGVAKCRTARSVASCEAKGGTAGTCASCCDACPVPGTGPSCPGTTTTTPTTGNQCCLRESTCGPYEVCRIMTQADCDAAGGFDVGPGDCGGPAPCARATTTTPASARCQGDQCSIESLCECTQAAGPVPAPRRVRSFRVLPGHPVHGADHLRMQRERRPVRAFHPVLAGPVRHDREVTSQLHGTQA